MKKVFIYSYNLELGGVERSLIALLDSFDPNEYEVDLFLAVQEGELLNQIPKHINLLPIDKKYQSLSMTIKTAIKKGYLFGSFARLYSKLYNRIIRILKKDKTYSVGGIKCHQMIIRRMKPQPKEYDLAISFAIPYFYILTKVNAKKKIGFIHTDYSKININTRFIRKMFDKIDYVASVSLEVQNLLQKAIKIDSNKLMVVENILSKNATEVLSNEEQTEMIDDSSIKILSIGRFGNAKNFDNVPNLCKRLLAYGLNIKWYLIGFGPQEQLIKQKIQENSVEANVIILGKKTNPYPYIKACDIYIQPSRYEGKAVTVREAQMLGKPVIITKFATSSSQLEDRVDGIIVPLDNEGCAKGIYDFIQNKELQNKIKENVSKRDYSNKQEVEKLYSIIN